jgi:putative ABC transport system substrate-binding protein
MVGGGTIYFNREFVEAGGLLSYGNNIPDAYRKAGVDTARILEGAKPADLPVDRASRFELIINLNRAKSLGLSVPNSMQLRQAVPIHKRNDCSAMNHVKAVWHRN